MNHQVPVEPAAYGVLRTFPGLKLGHPLTGEELQFNDFKVLSNHVHHVFQDAVRLISAPNGKADGSYRKAVRCLNHVDTIVWMLAQRLQARERQLLGSDHA